MLEGLRKPSELIVIVMTLLAYGCPIQAIVHAYGFDERTIASWRDRAGIHCHKVHHAIVEQGKLDLVHVQADEIRVKGRSMVVWMGLAIMVSTRLWVAGAVSPTRDHVLADRLLQQVHACAQAVRAILIATDGWTAYPNSIQRAFREKVKATVGKGRTQLHVWKELCIVTVIKRTEKHHVVGVIRKLTWGTEAQAAALLKRSVGGSVWNTAFIERINGTFRERLAVLTRKCRHAAQRLEALETGMYLIGCTYNFCWPHQQLSQSAGQGEPPQFQTPAMAAGLTDHIWSMQELLRYRVAPVPWSEQELAFRHQQHLIAQGLLKRPRGRPRKSPPRQLALPRASHDAL